MRAPLRLATRGSRQARAQATAVATAIERAAGRPVQLVEVETTGDVRTDVPLHTIGGQGVFVKEVQRAVLDGRADVAVHSAKDLPSTPAAGLRIAAFTERRDARDGLVGARLEELADGATIATGSVRRRAQLGAVRPDLRFRELRGNIDTRLARVPEGGAIVIAVAALQILGSTERLAERLPVERFVPAVGQGCVAVECRSDDEETAGIVASVDHPVTRRAVQIERAFLAELGGGCTLPVGAHVVERTMWTFIADPERGVSLVDELALDGGAGRLDADLVVARDAAAAARRAVGWRDPT